MEQPRTQPALEDPGLRFGGIPARARLQFGRGGHGRSAKSRIRHLMATRNGSAEWQGDLQSGTGELTVGDGAFSGAYSFASRFEEGEGTNPEELIAGAHAACYAMALSNDLASAGHTPDSVTATARVQLRNVDGAPTIAQIDLDVVGVVPGLDEAGFRRRPSRPRSTARCRGRSRASRRSTSPPACHRP